MIRPILAVALLAAFPPIVRAAGPCDEEAAAAKKAGRDPSLAGPTEPDAIEHMNEGNRHHSEGIKRTRVVATQDQAAAEFQAAIDAYVAAAMASAAPSILYNLAQTYRAAGDYAKAIPQYRQFLARAKPRTPLRSLIACHIASMTAEQERAASTAPPREPAATQEPERIDAAPRSSAAATVDASTRSPIDRSLDVPHGPAWYSDGVGWGIVGGGAAVAGVGAFLLLDASSLRTEASTEARDNVRIELRQRADDRQRWGTVATAAGAAVLVVGVVKLAITPDAPRSVRSASLVLSPTSIALQGRF